MTAHGAIDQVRCATSPHESRADEREPGPLPVYRENRDEDEQDCHTPRQDQCPQRIRKFGSQTEKGPAVLRVLQSKGVLQI